MRTLGDILRFSQGSFQGPAWFAPSTMQAFSLEAIEEDVWHETVKPRSSITMHMGFIYGAHTCPRCREALESSKIQQLLSW